MTKLLLAAVVTSLVLPLQASAQKKELTIINERDAFPIWHVYIRPAGDSDWGPDQLGSRTLAVGESYTWTIRWSGCDVDVRAVTFTGLAAERRRINVCGGFEWTVYDETSSQQSKSLTIVNRREAFPIWNVYITPAGDPDWGEDQLGDRVLGAGESYTWNIPWSGCNIDVKATTFTGLATQRMNVNVCGGMVWTIYDTNTQ